MSNVYCVTVFYSIQFRLQSQKNLRAAYLTSWLLSHSQNGTLCFMSRQFTELKTIGWSGGRQKAVQCWQCLIIYELGKVKYLNRDTYIKKLLKWTGNRTPQGGHSTISMTLRCIEPWIFPCLSTELYRMLVVNNRPNRKRWSQTMQTDKRSHIHKHLKPMLSKYCIKIKVPYDKKLKKECNRI